MKPRTRGIGGALALAAVMVWPGADPESGREGPNRGETAREPEIAAAGRASDAHRLAVDRPGPGAGTATLHGEPAGLAEDVLAGALQQALPQLAQARVEWGRDFYFTRAIYSGYGRWGRGGRSWRTDFPKADRQFLFILHRLLKVLDLHEWENPVSLADPELRRFPFLYMLEVGYMDLTEAEMLGLRGYLQAGGFLVVDDFWDDDEWANFERQFARVLPDRKIRPIPMDHPIFHQFYDIEQILQVPSINNAAYGRYGECWGPCEPGIYGIFDDNDELMVVINHNTDLGDAWEWSENPYYPIDRSTYAYELAINYIIYGLSH